MSAEQAALAVGPTFNAETDISRNTPEELDLHSRVTGRLDTMRNTVLTFVAERQYEVAIRELRLYQKFKSDLEVYKLRTDRCFNLCEEMILAIKALLSAPDLRAMPMAKRQTIYEGVVRKFEGLKQALDKLDQVENDIKIKDVRWTVKVLQVTCVCMGLLALWVATIEGLRTLDKPSEVVIHDISNFLMSIVGL